MTREIIFKKECDEWYGHQWFATIPEWEGSKSDLEMVSGADTMLDIIAGKTSRVTIKLSTENFDGADELIFQKKADDIGNGAYYKMSKYLDTDMNLDIWLCDVTTFIFSNFPNIIYIKKL